VLGLRQVAQLVLPELDEPDVVAERAVRQRLGRRGQEDLAAVAGSHDPRGAMDVEADVGVLADRSLAGMQPDADADRLAARPALLGQGPLNLDGGRDRLRRPVEGREERIALGAHLHAAVPDERRADELTVPGQQLRPPGAARLEQPGRALDVAEEERDGPGRKLGHEPGECATDHSSDARARRSARLRA
jgi:hypothetical protein